MDCIPFYLGNGLHLAIILMKYINKLSPFHIQIDSVGTTSAKDYEGILMTLCLRHPLEA